MEPIMGPKIKKKVKTNIRHDIKDV